MSNNTKAQSVVVNAYQMYSGNPSGYAEKPFPMYSHDRPANLFWQGFVEKLLDDGATEAQVEALLRHKHMRWMFDAEEDKIIAMGKEFAEGYFDVIQKEKIGEEE